MFCMLTGIIETAGWEVWDVVVHRPVFTAGAIQLKGEISPCCPASNSWYKADGGHVSREFAPRKPYTSRAGPWLRLACGADNKMVCHVTILAVVKGEKVETAR